MDQDTTATNVVRTLTKPQRRVLGVLVEKAFTTPDQYPLTCKSATSGSNQKSNRAPVTNYSEDAVMSALDELRELGLVLELHTESGRTARYRHQMRQHYTFTEPQLAILVELLLRGRQSLGDLRSRASRMVSIDSLEDLRRELSGLIAEGFVRAGGPLERRGVEVDHAMHAPGESAATLDTPADTPPAASAPAPSPTPSAAPPAASPAPTSLKPLEQAITELRTENRELREALETLQEEFRQLDSRFDDLRRDLGG